jgi:hypothetical protein
MTPLQDDERRTRTARERPRPHLRVADKRDETRTFGTAQLEGTLVLATGDTREILTTLRVYLERRFHCALEI